MHRAAIEQASSIRHRYGEQCAALSQSTLFPLYDRNPQTFVDNPLFPKPEDFRKATITLMRSADAASTVWLPVVPYVNSGSF
jgi:predicted acyl esterase